MNELMGFRCIMRKVSQISSKHGILRQAHEERRWSHDRYGRYTAHTGRSRRDTQSIEIHCSEIHRTKEAGGSQSWRTISSEIRGTRPLHRQKHQDRGQKIKPAEGWQRTINNFVAFRSLALLWKVKANDHWNLLPISSIHRSLPYDKVCYTGIWVRIESVRTYE